LRRPPGRALRRPAARRKRIARRGRTRRGVGQRESRHRPGAGRRSPPAARPGCPPNRTSRLVATAENSAISSGRAFFIRELPRFLPRERASAALRWFRTRPWPPGRNASGIRTAPCSAADEPLSSAVGPSTSNSSSATCWSQVVVAMRAERWPRHRLTGRPAMTPRDRPAAGRLSGRSVPRTQRVRRTRANSSQLSPSSVCIRSSSDSHRAYRAMPTRSKASASRITRQPSPNSPRTSSGNTSTPSRKTSLR